MNDGFPGSGPWRCFHCDEIFTDAKEAALHFGPGIYSDPACQVDAVHLRDLERELERYREDDTDLHRQIAAMESKHQQALMREEEAGYARGLHDARTGGLVTVNQDAARKEMEE